MFLSTSHALFVEARARPLDEGTARTPVYRGSKAGAPIPMRQAALAAHLIGGHQVGFDGTAVREPNWRALEQNGHLARNVDLTARLQVGSVQLAVHRHFAVSHERRISADLDELECRLCAGRTKVLRL